MNHWLAIGPQSNWSLGARKSFWSVSAVNAKTWSRIAVGDRLFYYVISPIKGVVGLGKITETFFEDKKCFWPDEMREKQVLWPYRLRFSTEFLLPEEAWATDRIPLPRGGVVFQKSFQSLKPEIVQNLMETITKQTLKK